MSSSILILGARSDMARACAQRFAREGYDIQLAARDPETLQPDAQDLRVRHGVTVSLHAFDALDSAGFPEFLDGLPVLPNVVLCAVGAMGVQADSQDDPSKAAAVLRANFEGPALILGLIANRFEARDSGTIIGISSVAGDRGRASNYVYGAAKAGFTAFLSGLRNRLSKGKVRVVTVKPGFVATKMTEGMDLPARLTAQPDAVADAIWNALQKGKDVIYVKGLWRIIMTIIRLLPEAVFKKTSL
ncbi:MAG: SDR family oxidoreductase [Paracoccaceae bacterium]